MADKFDPYREALIVETETQWPEEYDDWEPRERARVEYLLHQKPERGVAVGIRADAHGLLPADRRDAGGYSARDGVREARSKRPPLNCACPITFQFAIIHRPCKPFTSISGRGATTLRSATAIWRASSNSSTSSRMMRMPSSSPTRTSTSCTRSRWRARSAEQGCEVDLLIVDAGEQSKSIDVAIELWERMLEEGADRKSTVVAVGGGVVGDLAGFVAATFARGLAFVQVPTTLLAQVDSSVGGKVGINLPGAKNMVGAFWQPRGVLIDVERAADAARARVQRRPGRGGEVRRDPGRRVLRVSGATRRRDQRPRRGRAHAHRPALLPAEGRRGRAGRARRDGPAGDSQLRPHVLPRLRGGDRLRASCCTARAWRSACCARRGWPSGWAASTPRSPSGSTICCESFGLPTGVPEVSHEELIELMYHDKKVERGKLRFVLPSRLGHVEVVRDVETDDICWHWGGR